MRPAAAAACARRNPPPESGLRRGAASAHPARVQGPGSGFWAAARSPALVGGLPGLPEGKAGSGAGPQRAAPGAGGAGGRGAGPKEATALRQELRGQSSRKETPWLSLHPDPLPGSGVRGQGRTPHLPRAPRLSANPLAGHQLVENRPTAPARGHTAGQTRGGAKGAPRSAGPGLEGSLPAAGAGDPSLSTVCVRSCGQRGVLPGQVLRGHRRLKGTSSTEADTASPWPLSGVQTLTEQLSSSGAPALCRRRPRGEMAPEPLLPVQGPSVLDPRGLVGHRHPERTRAGRWGRTARTPSGLCPWRTRRRAGGGAGPRAGLRTHTRAMARQCTQRVCHLTCAPDAAPRATTSRTSV